MASQDATFGRNHIVWFSTFSSLPSEKGIGGRWAPSFSSSTAVSR